MKQRLLAAFIILLLLTGNIFPQATFIKSYTGLLNIKNVVKSPDGGYAMLGEDNQSGATKITLMKTDLAGTVQWTKSLGYAAQYTYSANKIIKGSNNNSYLLLGKQDGYPLLMRTNLNGDTLWTRCFQLMNAANLTHTVTDFAEMTDSSIVVTGATASNYAMLFKVDKNGNTVWANSLFGSSANQINKIFALASGEFFITGTTSNVFFIARMNASGGIIWSKSFNVMGTQGLNMIKSSDGNYVFMGVNGSGITLMKIDISANVYWAKNYGTGYLSTMGGFCLGERQSGGYVMNYTNGTNVYIFGVDPFGNTPSGSYISTFGASTASRDFDMEPDGAFGFSSGPNFIKVAPTPQFCMASTTITPGIAGLTPVAGTASFIFNTYIGTKGTNLYSMFTPVTVATVCGSKCPLSSLSIAINIPDSVCRGAAVTLSASVSAGGTFKWSENNVVFSSVLNPTRTFNVAGTQTIQLIVSGTCSDTTSKTIKVRSDCGVTGNPTSVFEKTYTNFRAFNGRRTADKGYILTGNTSLFGSNDMEMVKTDSLGIPQWGRVYGSGSISETGTQVIQTLDGGYLTLSPNSFVFAVKTNSAGVFQWSNNYQIGSSSTSAFYYLYDVINTPDSGVIVTGFNSAVNGMTFKINKTGGLVWANSFQWINRIIPGTGSNFYMIGINGFFTVDGNTGSMLSNKNYSIAIPAVSAPLSQGHNVIKTGDGNLVIFARQTINSPQSENLLITKVTPAGNVIWNKMLTFPSTWGPTSTAALEDSDNGFVLETYGGGANMSVIKLNAFGSFVDARNIFNVDFPYNIDRASDGAFINISDQGASIRKYTCNNLLSICNSTTVTYPVAAAPVAVVSNTFAANTYSLINNQFFVQNTALPTLTTNCSYTTCNVTSGFNAPLNVCTNQNVTFTNTSIGTSSYAWSENSVPVSSAVNYNKTYTTPGTYTVSLTAYGTGSVCSSSYVMNIVVSNGPTASVSSNTSVTCGGSTTLTASGGTSYTWSPATGLSNPNIANPVASPASTTAYSVTMSNGGGCTATAAVTVSVTGIPSVSVTGLSTVCQGSPLVLTATGATTYTWSANAGSATT
ncbi:MAG: hypothetical protein ACXVP0_06235, partial [Bacteroidia bacterium]